MYIQIVQTFPSMLYTCYNMLIHLGEKEASSGDTISTYEPCIEGSKLKLY